MGRMTVALGAVSAAWAVAAVGMAAAAAPVKLASNGEDPWVFVDRQGITHVAWDETTANQTRTMYARAAAGSTTFSAPVELTVGQGTDFAGIYITQDPVGDRLVMVTERCCTTNVPATYARTSVDGGVTWTDPVAIADPSPSVNPGNGRVNLVANGTAGIWLANGNPTLRVIKVPATLTPLVTSAQQVSISPMAYDGQVAFDSSGQPLFAFGDLTNTYVRIGESGADQLAFTSSIVPSIHLASGPRGTVVLGTGGVASDEAVSVRRLEAGALTPAIRLNPGDRDPGPAYVSADTAGRFHVVWRTTTGALVYRSSETGASWSPTTTLVRGGGLSTPYYPVVAAGSDATGWAVYTTNVGGSPVYAVRIGATVDPSVPDTTGIDNPKVTRRGSSIFVTPRNPSLTKLKRGKCVNVRVQTTKPAAIRVAIFSGRKSIRIFGSTTVRFKAPGARLVCIRVPLRAHTFDVRAPFRFAFAVRAAGTPASKPADLTVTGFTRFR